ncbi:MAG TPA: efflux RND transporter periplasmic adaptor subunit [Rhodocyclaceae bacterium]|nr:efflux RND transporter periplasmic adaptor subunit [Rhodocyclaceae bacterium]
MKIAFALLPALFLLAACVEKSPPADNKVAALKLVTVLKVSDGGTAAEHSYSGEVRARYESTLGFRIGGKMTERLVDAGARVKAGQPLARLDPADARLAAAQADANAALATADLKRTQDLRTKNFVSQAALDAREAAAKAAEAQAQLAKNQAAYATLFADASGVIAAVLAEPGQVMSSGQGVLRLARDGEREVSISLPETDLAAIRPGTVAKVSLWADGKNYQGRVREIAPAADSATRTFAARITITGADPRLPLGMTATVKFSRAGDQRIVVPLPAIFQQGDRPAVWVIDQENTATLRLVEVERYGDDGVVLKSGLNAGERIVAAGAFRLTAGEKVRIAEK